MKKIMTIFYEVRENGSDEILDSNMDKRPLEFIMGNGEVIAGLEEALMDSKEGDKKDVIIPPLKAYGEYLNDAIEELPITQFEGIELKQGMTLFGQSEDGRHIQAIVKDFNENSVIIDYNHPLAGKELLFNVYVVGVRDATEMELAHGLNMGGGCCGGGGGGGCCGGGHHHH